MPTASLRPCLSPGCGALVKSGRCPAHTSAVLKAERKVYDHNDRDLEAKAFYNSAAWIRCRDAFLATHPTCTLCELKGKLVKAEICDHIISIKHGGAKFDRSNLQSMCAPCHSAKSITDGDRFGRPIKYETRLRRYQ